MTRPYYSDDHVTIYHGNCLDILPNITNVGTVFTSPPYNLGAMTGGTANLTGGYRTYHDNHPDAQYVAWQRQVLAACWNTLHNTGAIFYNHKPIIKNGESLLPMRLNPDLPLRQIITWYRNWGVNWSASHFLPVYEWILVLAKRDWRLKSRADNHHTDVWRVMPSKIDDGHPAAFPLALPAKAIDASHQIGYVLDPFAGTGTTLRAAKDRGIKAIGIEIDEHYCELAAKRMAAEVLDFGDHETDLLNITRESFPDRLPADPTAQLNFGDWDGAA